MQDRAKFHEASKRHELRGRCLHFEHGHRCNEIISAHSIQRSGQLALIAESGHVYRLSGDLSTLTKNSGLPAMKRIGISKASTFNGMCKLHDNELFAPIDNEPLRPDRRQIALYSYRCLCREAFVKENAVEVLKEALTSIPAEHESHGLLRDSLLGHSIGYEGVRFHKHIYDSALANNLYEDFEFTYFESDSKCSAQFSGLLYPDFDFQGNTLQDLADSSGPQDLITFFTAPTATGWAFAFGWHASSNRTCVPFMQSLAHQTTEGRKVEDALLRFAISACENHALRLSWWDGLSTKAQQALLERMRLMAHPLLPVPPTYLVSGCDGIADWSFEYVQTTLQPAA